jgi:hypothetical protein
MTTDISRRYIEWFRSGNRLFPLRDLSLLARTCSMNINSSIS